MLAIDAESVYYPSAKNVQPKLHACFDKLEWEMYLYKHKAVPCEYGDITFFKLGKAVVGILAIYKDKTMLFWDKE